MRAGKARWACGSFAKENDGAAFVFHARGDGVEQEPHALGFERFLQLGGNLGIFARNNLFAGMQNGNAAAVAAKHLSKFQADIAGAENEEMFGENRELHDGLIGEIRDGIQAGDRGNVRAATGVDENLFAFEQVIAYLELMGANKTGVAAMETKVGAFVDLLLLAAAKTENHFLLLGNDFCEIDADVRCVDTPARGVSRVVRNLREMYHRLGRGAADVDARAAEIFFLNERHRPAKIRQPIGKRVAGLAGTNDDGLVVHTGGPPGGWNGLKTLPRMRHERLGDGQLFSKRNAALRDTTGRAEPTEQR